MVTLNNEFLSIYVNDPSAVPLAAVSLSDAWRGSGEVECQVEWSARWSESKLGYNTAVYNGALKQYRSHNT